MLWADACNLVCDERSVPGSSGTRNGRARVQGYLHALFARTISWPQMISTGSIPTYEKTAAAFGKVAKVAKHTNKKRRKKRRRKRRGRLR